MSTETAQLFFTLLTFVAAGGTIILIVLRIAAAAGSDGAARLGSEISDSGVALAFVVAATATLGSLYFSEVAEFIPCRLCWFQRIAMYPLSVILLVGAVRRDAGVRWYAGPLAVIGAVIAGYHTLIEWRPELDTGTCSLSGPSCTATWFREFGFVSLALMSLVGFLTILALLFVKFPATMETTDGGETGTPESPSPNSPSAKDVS